MKGTSYGLFKLYLLLRNDTHSRRRRSIDWLYRTSFFSIILLFPFWRREQVSSKKTEYTHTHICVFKMKQWASAYRDPDLNIPFSQFYCSNFHQEWNFGPIAKLAIIINLEVWHPKKECLVLGYCTSLVRFLSGLFFLFQEKYACSSPWCVQYYYSETHHSPTNNITLCLGQSLVKGLKKEDWCDTHKTRLLTEKGAFATCCGILLVCHYHEPSYT